MPSQPSGCTEEHAPAAPPSWTGRLWNTVRAIPRKAMTRASLPYWSVVLALLAGAALRLFFILAYPEFDGDSAVFMFSDS